MCDDQLSLFDPELFQPDGLAKETPWRDAVLEWLTREADCGARFGAFFASSVPSGFLERTCLAFCPSAVAWPATPSALFELCIQSEGTDEAAIALDALPEQDFLTFITDEIGSVCWPTWRNWAMGSPIGFSTLSGAEFPSAAVVSSLSDVLETGDVPPKYFLSAKACRGILRRAEKRGKELPPALHAALASAATPLGDDAKMIPT